MTSTQAVVTSTQVAMTSTQAVVTSTQAVVTSTQVAMTSTQAVVTSTQAVVTSTQAVVTSTQAVVTYIKVEDMIIHPGKLSAFCPVPFPSKESVIAIPKSPLGRGGPQGRGRLTLEDPHSIKGVRFKCTFRPEAKVFLR
ncbi:hypothetical protein BST81_06665 [Leptolyngbya sp. 'hensonii']|nr:hypothetical protein BST81_06665 [Leptolyngbya sp. 'hensonii']